MDEQELQQILQEMEQGEPGRHPHELLEAQLGFCPICEPEEEN